LTIRDGGTAMNEIHITPIPLAVAEKLCAEIREEVDRVWVPTPNHWCWICQQRTGGDPLKRGFLREPGNRGCIVINARYAEIQQKEQVH
jgi:hypothetical protein